MVVIGVWTGQESKALRLALRMTIEAFAEHLGVAVRAVAKWEARGSSIVPLATMQEALDTVLEQTTPEQQARFEALRPDTPAGPQVCVGSHGNGGIHGRASGEPPSKVGRGKEHPDLPSAMGSEEGATCNASLGRLLDEAGLSATLTRVYIQQMHTMPPRVLLPQVRGHLVSMQRYLSTSGLPQRDLLAHTAETLAVAGKLSFALGNYGDALDFYQSAEAAVVEAGHTALRAYVLGQSSHLHSSFWGTGPGSPLVRSVLNAAKAVCGTDAPTFLVVWLAARSAEEHAAAGDDHAALQDLESAQDALARIHRWPPPEKRFSAMSPTRLLS